VVCRLWKLFNADAKNEAVRVGAPATATNDYWGSVGGAPVEGGSPFTKVEGAVKALEDKIAKIEAELKGTKAPKVGKAVKNTKKGTVRLGVTVPSPGQLGWSRSSRRPALGSTPPILAPARIGGFCCGRVNPLSGRGGWVTLAP
jgi:hypothetical protein